MGAKSKIEWTDATWTPIRARIREDAAEIAKAMGYTSLLPVLQPGKVGPHCEKCSDACRNCYSETNNLRGLPHNGTRLPFDRRARDLVEIFLDEEILHAPFKWRTPRRVFVCSQTDLYGEFVPAEIIKTVKAVEALCEQHTFLELTKRGKRMLLWSQSPTFSPASNVWLGVSVGTARDKIQIAHLRYAQTRHRFVSFEPLLEHLGELDMTGIDLAIIGGESGAKARPFNLRAARSIIQQCRQFGTKVFVKQLGRRPCLPSCADPACTHPDCDRHWLKLASKKGDVMSEWPEEFQIREWPNPTG